MSDATMASPVLSPILAALAPDPAEPLPADDDVVEAYSFNTGMYFAVQREIGS